MKERVFRAAAAAWIGAALAALSGCGGDASRDPQVMQRFQSIETKLAEVRDLPAKVEDLNADFRALEVRIGILEKDPAKGGSQAIAANLATLGKRLTDLEARINALDAAVKKLAQRPATPAVKTPVTLRKTPAPKASTPAPKPAVKTPMTAKTPAPAPRGSYQRAEQGDTLQSFADRHKIGVDALMRANPQLRAFKPEEKLPLQQYWVPVK